MNSAEFKTYLKIEALKAQIETHKAYIQLWQAKIQAGVGDKEECIGVIYNHCDLIKSCVEKIKELY